MSLAIPYGKEKFIIADPAAVLASFSPDDDVHSWFFDEPENQAVELRSSPFDGTQWAIIRENNRSWEKIIIRNITLTEFLDQIDIYKGKDVTFTPHEDEPSITYNCIMTACDHSYNKNQYYKDEVIIRLTPKAYK